MSNSFEILQPADAGEAIAKLLIVLAEEVRRNPQLQRRLLAALAPVVTVHPASQTVDDWLSL